MENTAYAGPDQEILGYMNSAYSKEFAQELTTSLAILYELSHPSIQEELLALLNGIEGDDLEGLHGIFADTIEKEIDAVFDAWGISLSESATLTQKNSIISGLNMVMVCEDPLPYIRLLSTDLTEEEKIARIVSEFTTLTEVAVLEAILDASSGIIFRLNEALEKLQERQAPEVPPTINAEQLENFKKFCAYKGNDNLAVSMMENNFTFGLPLSSYFDYVVDYIDSDNPEKTAIDTLSLLFMCSDAWKAPIAVYRDNSEQLIKKSKDIIQVESILRSVMEGFEQYKRAL